MTIIPLHEPHFINLGLHTEIEPRRRIDWLRVWSIIGSVAFLIAAWVGIGKGVDFIARHI